VASHIGGAARAWAALPWCVGSPWPPSGSRLVLILHPGKIGVLKLILSNSENISYVAFLKHKNSKKQGTGTMTSCQYVSSGNRIKMPRNVTKQKANGVKTSIEHQKL
jgi:hypothetical protein